MVLEAIEDHMRGFDGAEEDPFAAQRVVRNRLVIEHLLPQRWETTGRSELTLR
jgi:hypothetical protein